MSGGEAAIVCPCTKSRAGGGLSSQLSVSFPKVMVALRGTEGFAVLFIFLNGKIEQNAMRR